MSQSVQAFELEWIDRSGSLRAKATLREEAPKEYRLQSGALCVARETPTLSEAGRRRRRDAREAGVLVESTSSPDCLELTSDWLFSSLSGAAAFVLGMSAQGSAWWSPRSNEESSDLNSGAEQGDFRQGTQSGRVERQRDEMKKFLTAKPAYESVMQEFVSLVKSMLTSDEWKPPSSVTSRIKSPESLMRKLSKSKEGVTGGVRSLEDVSDIIGVRVVFYSRGDLDEFNRRLELLRDELVGKATEFEPEDEVSVQDARQAWVEGIRKTLVSGSRSFDFKSDEIKDEKADSPGDDSPLTKSYYVARHWTYEYSDLITLKSPDSRNIDVSSIPYSCELQVVYIFDHVVNEVLHDLIYKDETRSRDTDGRLGDNLSNLRENLGVAERTLQGKIIEYLQRGSSDPGSVELP